MSSRSRNFSNNRTITQFLCSKQLRVAKMASVSKKRITNNSNSRESIISAIVRENRCSSKIWKVPQQAQEATKGHRVINHLLTKSEVVREVMPIIRRLQMYSQAYIESFSRWMKLMDPSPYLITMIMDPIFLQRILNCMM